MPLSVSCPKCRFSGSARESLSVKTIKCPRCGERFKAGPASEAPILLDAPIEAEPDLCESPILLPDQPTDVEEVEQFVSPVIANRQRPGRSHRGHGSGLGLLGLCAAGLLILVAGGAVAFLFVAPRPAHQREPVADQRKEVAGDERAPAASGVLAKHRWWRSPMSPSKIETIVAAVAGLQAEHERTPDGVTLLVGSHGTIQRIPLQESGSSPVAMRRTFALLQGADDTAIIQFVPGGRHRSAYIGTDESRDLLSKQLDAAYASEQKYKKTGKGDTVLDQLLDMKAPGGPEKQK